LIDLLIYNLVAALILNLL